MGSFVSQQMIFVTGASRSGTTLLTRILDGHSEIAGLRETHYFGEFCDPRRDPPDHSVDRQDAVATLFARQNEGILTRDRRSDDPAIPGVLQAIADDAGAAEVFATLASAFATRAGKVTPCEQTPRNIYYARELLEWYPRARFVHLLRDPRAVMASQKNRWRRRSLMSDPSRMTRAQQLRTRVNYHPYIVARLWNLATGLALDLENHPRFHLLRLEDLICDPERRVRELCRFLDIDFEPRMLEVEHVNSSYVATASAGRGFHPGTIDAWRSRLSANEQALAQRRCATLMARTGYDIEPVRSSRVARVKTGIGYPMHLAGAALMNPRRLWIQSRALLARGWPSARTGAAESNGAGASASNGTAGRVDVFGLQCVDVELDAAARHLVHCAVHGIRQNVAFVNAHALNVSTGDPTMQRALERADVIYADGVGMAMAARLQGHRLRHNVNGTDLFPHLCRYAAEAGVSIALLGAAPGVARACAELLPQDYPGLQVAWSRHGYVKPADSAELIDEINASGAGILLVAMGVPRQERWILEHADALDVPVLMGVGGLFDFVSGRVPRAPRTVRRLRMEWLFRLMVEPRRLFGRYVLGNPLFLARAFRYALTGRAPPARSREVPGR